MLDLSESSRAVAVPSASDLELTLSQIQDLFASRVVFDTSRQLTEIHIIASAARKPKQIIRDIETLVFVKHGLKLDYRKISMVQLADEDLLRIPLSRPEICNVIEDDLGDRKRIRVEIQGAGKLVTGEASEKNANPSTFRTAVLATIDAVQKLVGNQMDMRLVDTAALRLNSHEVLVVIISCAFEDREEAFVGASFVGTRPIESAARATLDALNRRIYLLTSRGKH